MDKQKAYTAEIRKKNAEIDTLIQYALEDTNILHETVQNLRSKQDEIRYNSYNILESISEKHPEALYDHWDFLIEQLRSTNTFYKYQAFVNLLLV